MSPTTPHTQDLRELIEWENVRHYRKLHESAWSDAIRAILPRLQKALSGIPSTTDARRVFMDGLEWEMNDAYYVIGTAQHCTIRLGQLPLQGIRMCSAYVQSAKFRSRDTESLRVFAEDFLEMFPIPPDVVQRIFDHMWWEDVVAYGKRGFPAPNLQTHANRRQSLIGSLEKISRQFNEFVQLLDRSIGAKEDLKNSITAHRGHTIRIPES